MRSSLNRIFVLLLLVILGGCQSFLSPSLPECPKLNESQQCFATLDQIAPTQMNIGLLSIAHRTKKIQKHSQEGTLQKYLIKKSKPAILAPDKRYYITDGHHLAYSLYNAAIPWSEKKILIEVIAKADHKSEQEFWTFMQENQYLYLKDNGEERGVDDLPKDISKMSNDSYRSLVWLAFKTNTLKKPENAPAYYDFEIAEKLRGKIDLNSVSEISRPAFTAYLDEVKKIID